MTTMKGKPTPNAIARPRPVTVLAAFLGAALACGGLTACGLGQKKAAPAAILPEVRVFTVEQKDFSDDVVSFGSVVYTRKNDITAAIEGIVESMPVREGDSVRTGSRLAALRNVQATIARDKAAAAVTSARAAARLAETEYEDARKAVESRFLNAEKTTFEISQGERKLESLRAKLRDAERLFAVGGVAEESLVAARTELANAEDGHEILKRDGAISAIGLRDSDLVDAGYSPPDDEGKRRHLLVELNTRTERARLEVARANVSSAETELSSAEALIRELTLESPISGIVGALYKETGERVEPGDKLMTVFASDDAWIAFPVDEGDAALLRKGMRVVAVAESIRKEPLVGAIDVISPTVDPQSGNVMVKALVRDLGARGKPGTFASVTVETGARKRAIAIPPSALLLREDSRGTVMIVRGGRAFERAVTLGAERKAGIEVTEGLSPGESVMLEPSPFIKEGNEVTPYEK